jgi:hypothetical protein
MGRAHFAHLNFRGTFKFGVSRYAQLLLSTGSSAGRKSV